MPNSSAHAHGSFSQPGSHRRPSSACVDNLRYEPAAPGKVHVGMKRARPVHPLSFFSDGDKSRAKVYKVGGKGLKTVRLSTSIKATGDARGWGAVRLAGPVKKTSNKIPFSVTCTADGQGTGDVWDSVAPSAQEAEKPNDPARRRRACFRSSGRRNTPVEGMRWTSRFGRTGNALTSAGMPPARGRHTCTRATRLK
ncbi:hypothetical protein GCM10009525_74710 [Streptosporangium amethystogenes subsp. fukuiense]